MSAGIEINSGNFREEVQNSPVPVLLDFWAEWCGPCRALGPLLDQIAQDYEGRIKLGKVNVDNEGLLAGQHSIVSIPTLVLYHNGKIVRKQIGAVPRPMIEALFTDILDPATA